MRKNITKISLKKILLLLVLLIVVGVGIYFLFLNKDENGSTENGSTINYGPPTDEEQAAGDRQKKETLVRDELEKKYKEDARANPGAQKKATVTIVSAGQYGATVEARAYITDIYEDGGICTATFTRGSQTVTQDSSAFKDATTIQCGALDIPKARFNASGDWQMTVSYKSSNANGVSGTRVVTIQ